MPVVLGSRTKLFTHASCVALQRGSSPDNIWTIFSGRKGDKDIALAGLSGTHVHVASTQLVRAAAEGDPERVNRIVHREMAP